MSVANHDRQHVELISQWGTSGWPCLDGVGGAPGPLLKSSIAMDYVMFSQNNRTL